MEITLRGTVIPEDATNRKIVWSIKSDGGTNSTLEGNKLSANDFGTVTLTATIANGLAADEDYTQDFPIVIREPTVDVLAINGIPLSVSFGEYVLNGKVVPANAINTTIIWSLKNAGTTGASLYGYTLTTRSVGTVVLTATVENGLGEKGNFTRDYPIEITRPVYTIGMYATRPDVSQLTHAAYWKDEEFHPLPVMAGTNNSFTTGIVFAGGRQYIAGYCTDIDDIATACYWVDGVLIILPKTNTHTRTLSIAAEGNTVYITGFDDTSIVTYSKSNICYWKIEGTNATQEKIFSPAVYNTDACKAPIAVIGGKVYIVYRNNNSWNPNTNNRNFYWDENGTSHPLNAKVPPRGHVPEVRCQVIGAKHQAGTPHQHHHESDAAARTAQAPFERPCGAERRGRRVN